MRAFAIARYSLCACVLALGAAACSSGTGLQTPAGAGARSAFRVPSGGSPSQYISHVIVIVQENRTLENIFAGYPGANAPLTGCAVSAAGARVRRQSGSGSGCPPGDVVVPLHQDTFENSPDLEHTWASSMKDWDHGKMDGFSKYGEKNGSYEAYAYVQESQVEPYWTMANQYVLADEMFPTEFGGSFTGHLTLVAGTDDIKLPKQAEVDFPSKAPDDCDSPPGTKSDFLSPNRRLHYNGPFPCFDQFNTIASVLDGAAVSWKMYATRVLHAGMWEPFEAIKYVRYGPDWSTNIVAPQTTILTDPGNGQLASVSWVTPSRPDSDHPQYDSDAGPSWVASVVNAIGQSSYWQNSAIIVVWDDWGGFYDNAAPPQLDYRGLGIRVPCLIISPYAKQNYVSHVQYEYGSILRFIEEVNNIPPGSIGDPALGYTDGRATSLDDAFDFTQQPRQFVPIGSKYPMSRFLHEPPSNAPVDDE